MSMSKYKILDGIFAIRDYKCDHFLDSKYITECVPPNSKTLF